MGEKRRCAVGSRRCGDGVEGSGEVGGGGERKRSGECEVGRDEAVSIGRGQAERGGGGVGGEGEGRGGKGGRERMGRAGGGGGSVVGGGEGGRAKVGGGRAVATQELHRRDAEIAAQLVVELAREPLGALTSNQPQVRDFGVPQSMDPLQVERRERRHDRGQGPPRRAPPKPVTCHPARAHPLRIAGAKSTGSARRAPHRRALSPRLEERSVVVKDL